MTTEAWLAAGFGAVFVSLLFATAIWLIASGKPVPPAAEWLLRVIMALAGAACGAMLSGMLTVDLNVPQLAVKATSGFALFVLIYLVNPPRRIRQQQTVGAGGTGIQIAGDNNTVLVAGEARLVLYRAHRARRPPANERELLLTELRATTLVGRDDELKALQSWLQSPQPISVRCLTGEGGAGKTRLGIELCERAEASGWAAGFARHDDLRRFHAQHSPTEWDRPRPTLVVVDYAAASIEVLRAWLEALARRVAEAKEPPLRVLLLERYADREAGWWAELLRPGGLSGRSPGDLFDPVEPMALRPLPSREARRALLAEAMAETARIRGITPAPAPPSPGADAVFDQRLGRDTIESEPLYLVMAGVVAVTSGAPAALALSRIDLAQRVVDSERNRLIRAATSAHVDTDLILHLAACVTLQDGCDRAGANALVKREHAAFGGQPGVRTAQLVRLLHDALAPAAGPGVDAVRPDLIGEAFLVREICQREDRPDHSYTDQRSAEEQAAIVTRAFRRAGQGVVETVIRTAQDFAEGDAAHPAVAWLDHLARLTEDPFALAAIGDALPAETLALRERAVEITGRIAEALRARTADDPNLLAELATQQSNLGVRLAGLGRREEAMAAAQEAADLHRALAAQRPDAFRPNLAMSLNNLAIRLDDLGRREEALAAAQEAADLYRALAAQRPDAFQPYLAVSLDNFARALSELGRREEALAAAQEAADLHRALAAQRPDAFRPRLALSLNSLAGMMARLGRPEEALATVREATEIRRGLAARRPDAFRSDLATSLNNLAIGLSNLGRGEEALAAAQEAADLYRPLAAQRPDAFRPPIWRCRWRSWRFASMA